MEFASDHYASVNIDHKFNGFFFNKVPLLKKLKWREVVDFKGLWGGLRKENNPALIRSLPAFPTNVAGQPTTYSLNGKPYLEGSIGVSNIFKVLRLDLVKRFTYLDNPDISKMGVRFFIKIEF